MEHYNIKKLRGNKKNLKSEREKQKDLEIKRLGQPKRIE